VTGTIVAHYPVICASVILMGPEGLKLKTMPARAPSRLALVIIALSYKRMRIR